MGKDYTQQFFTLLRGMRLSGNHQVDFEHRKHVIHTAGWRL